MMKLTSMFILFFPILEVNASPLFEDNSDHPLAVLIQTDLDKIRYGRKNYHTSTDNYIGGRLELQDKAFAIRLQTRGHNRFARCDFPPLRIYFDKSEIENSILEHNHNIKLVTHCNDDKLEQLFREYLVYKIYNLITQYSFQVRLLKIQYVDFNRPDDTIDSFAFFIESNDSVENRLNLSELESDQAFNMTTYNEISENWLNVTQTKLHDAFQHFIRNNDWVIFYTKSARSLSAANIKFFDDGKEGFPFPYDFDRAGVVTWDSKNYQYRTGAENLCQDADMEKALKTISDHKDKYLQLLNEDSLLSTSYKTEFGAYINEFDIPYTSCSRRN